VGTANVEGRLILFSTSAGAFLVLNKVGGVIWHMLSEPRRVQAVLDMLMAAYEVDGDTATRETIQFIKDLVGQGLLQIVER
jgi:hypothetical protein